MADLYFAKVPIRNTFLRVWNRVSSGNAYTSFMRRFDIDVVLDVGANKGQYGRHLIRHGFRGRIVSFEPLPSAFEKLQLNRWGFSHWKVEPFALGAANETSTLNVSQNSQSSSLQPMLETHVQAAPAAQYVDTCSVEVRRLDEIFDRYCQPNDRCYLKLDVQGHEHHVIEGARQCLERITAIEMELSMEPLYEGGPTWLQSIELMEDLGYKLMLLTPGFRDHLTGAMMQSDGLFVRKEAVQEIRRAA